MSDTTTSRPSARLGLPVGPKAFSRIFSSPPVQTDLQSSETDTVELGGAGREGREERFLIISILIFWLWGIRGRFMISIISSRFKFTMRCSDCSRSYNTFHNHNWRRIPTFRSGLDYEHRVVFLCPADCYLKYDMMSLSCLTMSCLVYLSFINYQLNSSAKKSSQMISFIKSPNFDSTDIKTASAYQWSVLDLPCPECNLTGVLWTCPRQARLGQTFCRLSSIIFGSLWNALRQQMMVIVGSGQPRPR